MTCVGCGPEARPALGFTSSLAQTQATLSPILQTRPGFLSHRPHPAQERGRSPWRPPQKHQSFLEQQWAGWPSLLNGLWPLTSRPLAICFPVRGLDSSITGIFFPRSSQLQTEWSGGQPLPGDQITVFPTRQRGSIISEPCQRDQDKGRS